MSSQEYYRKLCLSQQTELRRLMTETDQHEQTIQLFLRQHAMLHSARIASPEDWSYEDALLDDMPDNIFRTCPQGSEHTPAWLLWHMARCEDITMNLLVAGTPQILLQEDWLARLHISVRDTGNTMNAREMTDFSQAVDFPALRAYRLAVGRRTRTIVQQLRPEDIKQNTPPDRIQQVLDQGAVLEGAHDIVEYWEKRTTAGLLLMPATRHNLTHLNEMADLKRRQKTTG